MKEEGLTSILSTDGSGNAQEAGVGIVMESTNRLRLEECVKLGFKVTNNKAEYEALIHGLELACHLSIRKLKVRGDSAIIDGQMNRVYKVKKLWLKRYFDKATAIIKYFDQIEIQQVPRELNQQADELAKRVSTTEYDNKLVISKKTIQELSILKH